MAEHPHCDQSVLHAPGVCEYCDMYPERQQGRIAARIDFTGAEPDPRGVPDPATLQRPLDRINRWHGNVPMTPDQKAADDKYYKELDRALEYVNAGPLKTLWLKVKHGRLR